VVVVAADIDITVVPQICFDLLLTTLYRAIPLSAGWLFQFINFRTGPL